MRRLSLHALIALVSISASPLARAQLPAVSGLQPLLLQAILDGYAEGAYQTEASRDFFQREFATAAPLEYRVTRLEAIDGQPECARLSVTASQRGVLDRNATRQLVEPQDLAVTWHVAYCKGGHYAGSGG